MAGPRSEIILVIDDNAEIARLLRLSLEREGYDVIAATTGAEGIDLAALHQPVLILLDMVLPDIDGFEVCRTLSRDLTLRNIPVIAITGHETARRRLPEALECIDDYIFKPFDIRDLETRVKLSMKRSRMMTGSNPLTRLPGNVAIQDELMNRIDLDERFALMYVDLDEFKAFNDHYGFLRGDEAIKLLARCCREAVTSHAESGFLGHIGGDDLAIVVEPKVAEPIAEQISAAWDDLAPNLYEPEDAARGFIELADRRGQLQQFPLATVSIGVATNSIRPIRTHWEAAELAAEMKHVAKSRPGSAIAIDRRKQVIQEPEAEPAGV